MIESPLSEAISNFHRAADAVAAVLATTDNWGASGQRAGQYAVDLDADAACLDVLYGAGYTVLSEESGITSPDGSVIDARTASSSSAPVVVVDPLDGSTNASHQIPWFATACCLVDGDGPAAGLVANHATGQRYVAVRGGGAERDGRPISTSGVTELRNAMVGFSGLPTHHYGWRQLRIMGASAPDICNVASGVTDAWADAGAYHGVWDYLAAVLIVGEAGGAVTEVNGNDLCVLDHNARRGPVVAATPQLLEEFLAERTKQGG